MLYIKLDDHKNLAITVNEPIYRGENLSGKITFLVPMEFCGVPMESAALYLNYIRADGTADINLLKREEELYKEVYYQFTLPITSTLSRYPGPITTWLNIYAGPAYRPTIIKSGECVLNILASTNMDEYISDRNLGLIYDMQRQMADMVGATDTKLDEAVETIQKKLDLKADGIFFDEEDSTIQLYATVTTVDEETEEETSEQVLLGDPIFVRSDKDGDHIANMEVSENGELIATFDSGETMNLGSVVGKDGKVYVPHVDERKILTFTIEDAAGDIPPAVDLDPSDEWSNITNPEDPIVTSYTWEEL